MNFEIGDIVKIVRDPTDEEWEKVGRVPIKHLYDKELKIKFIQETTYSLMFEKDNYQYCYPHQVFELINDKIEINENFTIRILEE